MSIVLGMNKMEDKKWFGFTIFCMMSFLILIGGITIFVDPFFHYHKPYEKISYIITNERYQNDGISRNFDYTGVIIGNSNVEDFKASECSEILGGEAIKLPYSGAYYKELNEALEKCFERNDSIAYVVRGMDTRNLLLDKNQMAYESYPNYLYNDNYFDDMYYFWNKEILVNYTLRDVVMTMQAIPTTTMDEYANSTYAGWYVFGKETVLSNYVRTGIKSESQELTTEEKMQIEENLEQNVISTIKENPDTEFYLFFPPFSICMWDQIDRSISITKEVETQRVAIEKLLQYDNVKLFSFFDNFELITNLDNYRDKVHYSGDISSNILKWMGTGEYQLTTANYEEYLESILEFYSSYNYNAVFEED